MKLLFLPPSQDDQEEGKGKLQGAPVYSSRLLTLWHMERSATGPCQISPEYYPTFRFADYFSFCCFVGSSAGTEQKRAWCIRDILNWHFTDLLEECVYWSLPNFFLLQEIPFVLNVIRYVTLGLQHYLIFLDL